jgi:syntaxin-binding protein 1
MVPSPKQISNVCISLNEYPSIRYYLPSHHPPLGPLKPHASTRPPPPSESGPRWRTNLARGAESRAYESVEGDYATKLLAFMVQQNLDEYRKANPDFGVGFFFGIGLVGLALMSSVIH